MGSHDRVGIANARRFPSVGRKIQQYLGYGRSGRLCLGNVDKLAFPCREPAHQRCHHREDCVLSRRIVYVRYFGHYWGPVPVSGGVGQSRGPFRGWPCRPEVGPWSGKPITGGGHHDNVRPYAFQLFVSQAKVPDDPRGEVFRKYVANRYQPTQNLQPLRLPEIQRDAQLVAILLVEVRSSIPELPVNLVFVDGIAPVALQAPR